MFCEYFIDQVEYNKLLLDSIVKDDYVLSETNSAVPLISVFSSRQSFVYVWASWCLPCIDFIKRLSMEKIRSDTSLSLIFLSIDDNKINWRLVSKKLGVSTNNFLLEKGLKSRFAKSLRVDHVPLLIGVNGKRIDRLNVPKQYFERYFY